MAAADVVDARYYQVVAPNSLGERLIVRARDRIYQDFLRLCTPAAASRLLDVGASDVLNDGANVLERKYPHPERITALGLGAAEQFQAAFPAVTYRRVVANATLPFEDKAFDIATSNAVLEHVGGPAQRAAFVAELARVAHSVFISVPNRYFPVEHHTAIPLLHYHRAGFTLACRALGKTEWLDPETLDLVGRRELMAAVPEGVSARIGYTGISLGPFSSNLFMFLRTDIEVGHG